MKDLAKMPIIFAAILLAAAFEYIFGDPTEGLQDYYG